jgi:hypothetical protein
MLVVVAGWLPACTPAEPHALAGDAVAGQVVSLHGDAWARRSQDHAARRALQVAAEIFADDVVTTGPRGEVIIELAHNRARWTLGPGQSRRVDASLAWNATPSRTSDRQLAAGEDRTAAGGRHAEPSATTVAAAPDGDQAPAESTSRGSPGGRAAPGRPEELAPAAAPTAELAAPAAEPRPAASASPPAPQKRQPAPARSRSRPSDKLALDVADSQPAIGGASSREPRRARSGTGRSRGDVLRTVEQLRPKLKRCATAHAGTGQTIVVKLTIAPDGKVTAATVDGERATSPLGRCVVQVIQTGSFSPAHASQTLDLPIAL